MQQRYGLQERQNVSLVLPSSGHAESDTLVGGLSLLRKDLARCPVCKTPMVSKGSFGYDQRYPGGVDVDWLECPNCSHTIND